MDIIEPVKRLAEKTTGLGMRARHEALARVRRVRPATLTFRDDGYIPNNRWPVLIYRKVIALSRDDPAALIEAVFNANGWGDCWRDGIYFYVHYHSRIHEALGVARGHGLIRLGGNKGKSVKVSAGDLLVIPAGVGHECLSASRSFLVVGAYPLAGTYDECRGSFGERAAALKAVPKVKRPENDPMFGSESGLRSIWR